MLHFRDRCFGHGRIAQPRPVRIEQEPMHLLKLANEYVRVFGVELPPGNRRIRARRAAQAAGAAHCRADLFLGALEAAKNPTREQYRHESVPRTGCGSA